MTVIIFETFSSRSIGESDTVLLVVVDDGAGVDVVVVVDNVVVAAVVVDTVVVVDVVVDVVAVVDGVDVAVACGSCSSLSSLVSAKYSLTICAK